MEYTDEMQTLIFKTSIDIIIILLLLAVSISLIWIAMFFYYKKNKKTNRKGIKSSFIGSSTLTVICLLFSFATIPSFDLRPVTIENDSEPLWFDRMSNFNVNIKDSGTIVYGKNSRYIVKIENMR